MIYLVGATSSTTNAHRRRPVTMLFSEAHASVVDAVKRDRQLVR